MPAEGRPPAFDAPLEAYTREAEALWKALQDRSREAAWAFRWEHPRYRGKSAREVDPATLSLEDARLVIAHRHAFETWGCRRVELKTDALNDRSRGAMEAMGATFEGVHRKHMLVRGGENRDSAWYSVTDDDWPGVRDGLVARLETTIDA